MGTGGGTVTALCSGLASRLVSLGFCLHTVDVDVEEEEGDVDVTGPPLLTAGGGVDESSDDFGDGSPPAGDAAGRLTPAAREEEVADATAEEALVVGADADEGTL